MNEQEYKNSSPYEPINGYIVKRATLFDNNRGFAIAENPNAVQPLVTWQFTEEDGKHDYYWGHYTESADMAEKDYEMRVADYQRIYGVSKKSTYEYSPATEPSKESIVKQMKEGAEQAARNNTTRPIPSKGKNKEER